MSTTAFSLYSLLIPIVSVVERRTQQKAIEKISTRTSDSAPSLQETELIREVEPEERVSRDLKAR